MIFWSGKGVLVLLLFGALYFVFTMFGGIFVTGYSQDKLSYVGFTCVLVLSAIINYFFASWIDNKPSKVYIDKETNEEVVFVDGSSLFFISVRYWTYIFLIGAIYTFIRIFI